MSSESLKSENKVCKLKKSTYAFYLYVKAQKKEVKANSKRKRKKPTNGETNNYLGYETNVNKTKRIFLKKCC